MDEATRMTQCRSCGSQELVSFLDLGLIPLVDWIRTAEELEQDEPRYPLEVALCHTCGLVQILHNVPPTKLFVDNYPYFSSFSDALVEHARQHAKTLVDEKSLDASSLVVEIASNDGYLLRHFAAYGIPVLGVDPAPAQASAAIAAGIPTLEEFFDRSLGERIRASQGSADVIIANNVLAHVPDPNELVAGWAALLAEDGTITIENPWVLDLVRRRAFDTIYHEHYSYLSCHSVQALLVRHGLYLNHVEYFADLHAGTLRWWASRHDRQSASVRDFLARERDAGGTDIRAFEGFGSAVDQAVHQLRTCITDLVADGATIAAYGAAAKGAVLLNVAGLGPDVLQFVADRNPHKQGRYMPGVDLPIVDPSVIMTKRPSHLLLLAWNFADEIMRQQQAYHDDGGRFIIPLPAPKVI